MNVNQLLENKWTWIISEAFLIIPTYLFQDFDDGTIIFDNIVQTGVTILGFIGFFY